MGNKRKFLSIIFGLLSVLLITAGNKELDAEPGGISTAEKEDKVYTVREAVGLLKTAPGFFKDKSVRLEGYVVGGMKGTGCNDYQIITDKEYVKAFKNRYDGKLSPEERSRAAGASKLAPVLLTGQTQAAPDIYPTYHAVYQGHFYDKWAEEGCGAEGYKRFVIEKKVKEIVSAKQPFYRTKTVSSGIVIANGRYIKKPYKIVLKDYLVTINGVLYEPATTEGLTGRITEFTDAQRLETWKNLVSSLERDRLIIYGGNKYESSMPGYPPTLVSDIRTLIKSGVSGQSKREKLAKLLDVFPEHVIVSDILKNWE